MNEILNINTLLESLLQGYASARAGVTRLQRGFSLIELMIGLSILSVLALLGVNFMVDLLVAPAKAMAVSNQQTQSQTVSEAIDSTLKHADELSVGVRGPGGAINPLTMAGDQIVFTVPSGRCYRIWYLGHGVDQLREAISDDGCSSIMPKRGPNQLVDGDYATSPDSPLYDPQLDDPDNNSVLLADFLRTGIDGSDEIRIDNAPFTYLGSTRLPNPVDPMADSASDNPYYSDPGVAGGHIAGVTFAAFFGSAGKADLAVKPTPFKQTTSTQLSP